MSFAAGGQCRGRHVRMVAGLRRRAGWSNNHQIHGGGSGASDCAELNQGNSCRVRGPADSGTRSRGDRCGYTNCRNEDTCVASDMGDMSGRSNRVRGSAGCSDVYNSRVLRNEGGANASEESKGGIFLLLGAAPGPNAPANFVCEFGRWAEACSVAVGVALMNGEPCVETLGYHIRARGGNGGRARVGSSRGADGARERGMRVNMRRCCARIRFRGLGRADCG